MCFRRPCLETKGRRWWIQEVLFHTKGGPPFVGDVIRYQRFPWRKSGVLGEKQSSCPEHSHSQPHPWDERNTTPSSVNPGAERYLVGHHRLRIWDHARRHSETQQELSKSASSLFRDPPEAATTEAQGDDNRCYPFQL